MLVGYRTGDMWAPKVSLTEALSLETPRFVELSANGAPLTDGKVGPADRAHP